MIVLFHYGIPIRYLDTISSFGNCGVDIFLFLSSFGLCYSINKSKSLNAFYKRRYMRVLPMFWLILVLMHLRMFLMGEPYPKTLIEGLMYYSGIGWFFRGLFGYLGLKGVFYYEWYIPTLLQFYLLFPLFYKMITKKLLWLIIISIVIGFSLASLELQNSIHLSYRRLPIFLLGILFFRHGAEINDLKVTNGMICTLFAICISIVVFCNMGPFRSLHKTMFIYSLSFGVICPVLLMIFAYSIEKLHLSKVLAWFGVLTLELYLVHIYCWPRTLLKTYIDYPDLCYILALFICIIIAYFLHLADERIRIFLKFK